MNTKANREIWTKLTVEGIWEWVWGDKGARKGPDLKLIAGAERAVEGTQLELRGLEAQLDELERRAKKATALTEKEGIVLLLEIMTTSRALAKVTARHERSLRNLEIAQATLVPIDDAAAEVPEAPETEMQFISYADEDERPLVRTELRTEEFRWAVGFDILPKSTLRRWVSGTPAFPAGDRRNLFDPPFPGETFPAVVRIASAHKRYIQIDKLDPSRFHADAWERLLELCRRREQKPPSRGRPNLERSADGYEGRAE